MFTDQLLCMTGQVGQYRTGFKDTEVENTEKSLGILNRGILLIFFPM
jgi:hypothetical protein